MAERFRPSDRVRRGFEHRALLRAGARVHSAHFLWLLGPNAADGVRIGLTVSKRAVPRAVDRNRVRRVAREVFRRHRELVPPGTDVVLVAKAGAQRLGFEAALVEWRGVTEALVRAGRTAARRMSADRAVPRKERP